jgi:glycosyltransferase involved in cell wall biosynthesis
MTHFGFVSTIPPTRCGLATFTEALALALLDDPRVSASIVRVLDEPDGSRPTGRLALAGPSVDLIAGDASSMRAAAATLSACDVAIVQHEYGIYGGTDGDEVLELLGATTTPAIVVLHTVLPSPTAHQRDVLIEVCRRASAVVVMTERARLTLARVFGVDGPHVRVVPHGVTTMTTGGPPAGAARRVLTWGLISPGKGIEWGIRAMSLLRDVHPPVHYLVAGQTHPKVLARSGERYREVLTDLVASLELEHRVRLDSRYLAGDELASLLATADAVLLPYDSRDQATSGVLSEAVAAGIPVVATAFPHASELLADGAGLIVPHEDPASMADALRAILTEDAVADTMRRSAARGAANTGWPVVAEQYRAIAAELAQLQLV